jgi:abortive infection Abi-like protein
MANPETSDRFLMRGARAAAANGMPHISEQIAALERAVVDNPSLAFDLAKYIVESTCKTILTERKIGFDKRDNLPKLYRAVINNVPLLPLAASAEREARDKLERTLNGLHTALQGVCELRNSCGFASHGGVTEKPAMEAVQALLAAQSADAIVGFLFSAHRVERDGTQPKSTGHSRTIDKLLDTVFPAVDIAGQPYDVSEALYATDREAYVAVAASVDESRNVFAELDAQHPASLKPTIREIRFLHYEGVAYLKTVDDTGNVELEDTAFISGGREGELFFPLNNSADVNAELLVQKLDGYSIINCFDLFTSDAAQRIADELEANRPQPPLLPEASAGASQ